LSARNTVGRRSGIYLRTKLDESLSQFCCVDAAPHLLHAEVIGQFADSLRGIIKNHKSLKNTYGVIPFCFAQ
jgi:hypothetical protein